MASRKKSPHGLPAKGRMRDIADDLWSNAVRSDWNWRCAVCGNRKCEAHHLFPRQHESTRYELVNGIALCYTHHQSDAAISPHLNAAGWLRWLETHHPNRHKWYVESEEDGWYKKFDGTKNWVHYVEVIQGLREYVEPEDFERIVGVKFSAYLEQERMAG